MTTGIVSSWETDGSVLALPSLLQDDFSYHKLKQTLKVETKLLIVFSKCDKNELLILPCIIQEMHFWQAMYFKIMVVDVFFSRTFILKC